MNSADVGREQVGDRRRRRAASMTVPWWATGRKPAVKLPWRCTAGPRGSGRTTNVGRLSVRRAQAVARARRPCTGSRAAGSRCSSCSWPGRGRSSSTPSPSGTPGRRRSSARCGKTLLTQRPHSPCCWNANGLFISLPGRAGDGLDVLAGVERLAVQLARARACSRTCPSG